MMLIGRTIVGTKMDDVRFLRGQNIVDAITNDFEFGKQFTLTFAPAQGPEDDRLVGCIKTEAE